MTTHPQVEVNGINVDEGLADLLALLWERDIATQFSCQGGGLPLDDYLELQQPGYKAMCAALDAEEAM